MCDNVICGHRMTCWLVGWGFSKKRGHAMHFFLCPPPLKRHNNCHTFSCWSSGKCLLAKKNWLTWIKWANSDWWGIKMHMHSIIWFHGWQSREQLGSRNDTFSLFLTVKGRADEFRKAPFINVQNLTAKVADTLIQHQRYLAHYFKYVQRLRPTATDHWQS